MAERLDGPRKAPEAPPWLALEREDGFTSAEQRETQVSRGV